LSVESARYDFMACKMFSRENGEITENQVKEGLKAAWPICLGYLPIGMALGIVAQKAGLQPWEIGLMSILVFAGSSQFIAVSMLNSGAAVLSIVVTTFIVNLRHTLMSSSLAIYLQGTHPAFLSFFSYGVTDESFAVNLTRFRGGHWHRYQALIVNQVSNATWIGSTILGAHGGQFIPPGAFGIDYALIAMFLCLLVFQLRGRIYVITAIVSGGLAVFFSLLIPGNLYVILASLMATTIGFGLRRHVSRKGSYSEPH
jgi:4-azaleucine resistance transporter AzlC